MVLDLSLVAGLALVLFSAAWLGLGRPRRVVSVALAIGAVLVALIGVWKLSSVRMAVLGPTVLHVPTDARKVALTLDDGPSIAYTNHVLDLLDAAEARATFFVTGHELAVHPELGREILARGHELGNHSWSHPRLIFRSARGLRDEVERTDTAIRDAGQDGPIAFRPPFGKRLLGLHAVLGARPVVLWDIEPESYPDVASDPGAIAAHVLERARPGSIVLLHVMYESREPTRAALPAILRGLRDKGLEVTTLRDLTARRALGSTD